MSEQDNEQNTEEVFRQPRHLNQEAPNPDAPQHTVGPTTSSLSTPDEQTPPEASETANEVNEAQASDPSNFEVTNRQEQVAPEETRSPDEQDNSEVAQ